MKYLAGPSPLISPGRHAIVVDLGYGDAGKGSIVDWLCGPAAGSRAAGSPAAGTGVHAVVRFNGGAQAAHNVVTPGGQHHTFAQFGSGTLSAPGTRTFLSRFMLVDPLALVAEAGHLASLGVPDPLALVAIDRDALLTTPYHQAANRSREAARGAARHGSCGMGIGETAAYALRYPGDAPRAGDCGSPRALARKLALLCERLRSELAGAPAGGEMIPPPEDVAAAYRAIAGRVTVCGDGYLARLLRQPGSVVFEGAQGVLLDEWRGFHPYTTWSTTTFGNAEALLAEAGMPGAATRLGVTRAYLTRHGPGPFVTEDPTLELPEPHNHAGRWQGTVRKGHLDAVALRYAIEACGGVDAVALTHLDTARQRAGTLRLCRAYRWGESRAGKQGLADRLVPGPFRDLGYQQRLTGMLLAARPVYSDPVPPDDWPDAVAELAGAPVTIRSYGPSRESYLRGDLAPARGSGSGASEPASAGVPELGLRGIEGGPDLREALCPARATGAERASPRGRASRGGGARNERPLPAQPGQGIRRAAPGPGALPGPGRRSRMRNAGILEPDFRGSKGDGVPLGLWRVVEDQPERMPLA